MVTDHVHTGPVLYLELSVSLFLPFSLFPSLSLFVLLPCFLPFPKTIIAIKSAAEKAHCENGMSYCMLLDIACVKDLLLAD